jgi:hypothetical protein
MQECALPENEHFHGIGGGVRQVNFFFVVVSDK